MIPALWPGQYVVGLRFGRPREGSVVIAQHMNREIVKRVERLTKTEVYLIGDHKTSSTDSRDYGTLPRDVVRAVVIWPRLKQTP